MGIGTTTDIMRMAAGLISEPDNPNPEYDRALAEMAAGLLGFPAEHKDLVLTTIRHFAGYTPHRTNRMQVRIILDNGTVACWDEVADVHMSTIESLLGTPDSMTVDDKEH